MPITSNSRHIVISTYDSRMHINGGISLPINPDVGQLFYHNSTINVWNGYTWIPVQDTAHTTISTSPDLERFISKMLLNEIEEQQLMLDFPEVSEAYNEYKNLLVSAKIVAKMRNSNLANTGT